MIVEGNVSVKAAVLSGRYAVRQVWIDRQRQDRDTCFIERTCRDRGIPVSRESREAIDEKASGRTHGGVLAECGPRQKQELKDLLQKEKPFLMLAEGIEDPFNLGYVMRSLYACGCDGLILEERDWKEGEAVILKSSAGAAAYLDTVCMDVSEAVRQCRSHGLKILAAMRRDAIPYTEADFRQPCLLCLGGEMRGLSAGVRGQSDQNLYIPYTRSFRNALNAAAAAAVLGFEVQRQRQSVLLKGADLR
jgi:23S rRNA (guanosine2251-2'-O)-methyltransferase